MLLRLHGRAINLEPIVVKCGWLYRFKVLRYLRTQSWITFSSIHSFVRLFARSLAQSFFPSISFCSIDAERNRFIIWILVFSTSYHAEMCKTMCSTIVIGFEVWFNEIPCKTKLHCVHFWSLTAHEWNKIDCSSYPSMDRVMNIDRCKHGIISSYSFFLFLAIFYGLKFKFAHNKRWIVCVMRFPLLFLNRFRTILQNILDLECVRRREGEEKWIYDRMDASGARLKRAKGHSEKAHMHTQRTNHQRNMFLLQFSLSGMFFFTPRRTRFFLLLELLVRIIVVLSFSFCPAPL